jgi:hypothetical protein
MLKIFYQNFTSLCLVLSGLILYICLTCILYIWYFVTFCVLHYSLLHLIDTVCPQMHFSDRVLQGPCCISQSIIYYFRASFHYWLINIYSNALINYAVYTLIKSIVYITVMRSNALHLNIHIDSNNVVLYLVIFAWHSWPSSSNSLILISISISSSCVQIVLYKIYLNTWNYLEVYCLEWLQRETFNLAINKPSVPKLTKKFLSHELEIFKISINPLNTHFLSWEIT